MRPPEDTHSDHDAQLGWTKKFVPNQLLPTVDHGSERDYRSVISELFKGIAKTGFQPPIAMPNRKEVVSDQASAGHEHEATADP